MIISENILKLIYTQLNIYPTGATAWYSYMGPDEAVYPFITFTPIALKTSFAFTADYEQVLVQFSVFDDDPQAYRTVNILTAIEKIFARNCNNFELPDTTCGMHLVCIKKLNENVRYLEEDHYWMGTIEFEFRAQKDACCAPFDYSSSSSSLSQSLSSSSSSSTSSGGESVSSSSSSYSTQSMSSESSVSELSESSSSSSLGYSTSSSSTSAEYSSSSSSLSESSSSSISSESSSSISSQSESSESSSSSSSTEVKSSSSSSSSSLGYSTSSSSSSISSQSMSSESQSTGSSESSATSSSTSYSYSFSTSSSSISSQSMSSQSESTGSSESSSSYSSSSTEWMSSSSTSSSSTSSQSNSLSSSSSSMSSYIPYWSSSSSTQSASSSSSKSLSSSSTSESESSSSTEVLSSSSTEAKTSSSTEWMSSSSTELQSSSSSSSTLSESSSSTKSVSSSSSKSISSSSSSSLSDSPYAKKVTGDGDIGGTSPNGYYSEDGLYNTKMSYVRSDSGFYIWWNSTYSQWIISVVKGNYPIDTWHKDTNTTPNGTYNHWYSTDGHPIVEDAANVSSSSSTKSESSSSTKSQSSSSSESSIIISQSSSSSLSDSPYTKKVTGNGNPSPNGWYLDDGIYNGVMSYVREDSGYYLWYNTPSGFILSLLKGIGSSNSWYLSSGANPNGTYDPLFDTTGNPVVEDAPNVSSSSSSSSSSTDTLWVKGTINPDVTNSYTYGGQYAGYDYYKSDVEIYSKYWYIFNGGPNWVIGDKLGGTYYDDPYWVENAGTLIGNAYMPQNGASGTAEVAQI